MWSVVNCMSLSAFLCMREGRQSTRLHSHNKIDTHTQAHTFWWVVLHCSYTLPDQRCSPGFFRSLTLMSIQLPPSILLYQCHPSSSHFSLLSLYLINQCQAVQQQGQHSFLACLLGSSYMSLCPDPPPSPTQQSPSSFHEAETQAHTANMKGCSEAALGRGRKWGRHFSHLCLFFLLFFCLPLARERKGCHSHLHNSWEAQEKMGHWVVKKSLDGALMGVGGYVCQSLCPWTLYFSPFITTPHTHSHCPMFVINLWYKSAASLPTKTYLQGKEIISSCLGKAGKLMFYCPFFADVEILMDTAEAKVINLNVQGGKRERQGFT